MAADLPVMWLDISRLVSRTGRGPFTGIDRVEFAYLEGLLARGIPLFGFARTATGYVLLDRNGLAGVHARIVGRCSWGRPDMYSHLSRRLSDDRKRAEADLRRLALASCLRVNLAKMLRRHVRSGAWLVNVGHSNLSDRVLREFRDAGGRIAVMVHDTIPLDLPTLHRPGMPQRFAQRIAAVAACADLVITPSEASADRIRPYLRGGPRLRVVQPGVRLAEPDPEALRRRVSPDTPYFVSVGTIDGRKNQALLLDVWGRLGPGRPSLYLVGSRGWCPPDLSRRLDPPQPGVTELNGLPDGAVAALVSGAAGLLHPSLAEGFGYPPLEAALRGVPVAMLDLPVYRETLGNIGVYLTAGDLYHWKRTVEAMADAHRQGGQEQTRRPNRPTWDAHLNLVLSML